MKRAMIVIIGMFWLQGSYAFNEPEFSMEVGTGIRFTENANLLLMGVSLPAKPLFETKSYYQFNLGGWDGTRKASLVGIARGLQWDNARTRVRLSTGASVISKTSDRLSTAFQFYEQFMVEHRVGKTAVALSYRHWSNAFVKLPNRGMDFLGLQVEARF